MAVDFNPVMQGQRQLGQGLGGFAGQLAQGLKDKKADALADELLDMQSGLATPGINPNAQQPIKADPKKLLQLAKINPEMAKFVEATIAGNNAESKAQMQTQTDDAARFATLALDANPDELNGIIMDEAKTKLAQGQDASKLLEIMNMESPSQKKLALLRMQTSSMQVNDIIKNSQTQEKIDETNRSNLADESLAVAKFNHDKNKEDSIKVKDLSTNTFANETTLRKEFTNITKDFAKVNDSFGRIKASATDPSAAGDLALIFNYMKVLDPGSTVREGEFANAQNTGSVDQRVSGLYNRVISGERLTASQRGDFVDRATKLFNQAKKAHTQREGEFRRIATKNNLDPDNVVFDRTIEANETETVGRFKVKIK